MTKEAHITKILFVDTDEISFQFRKCMAMALSHLPPVELYHANDATEGLSLLEDIKPDVVVLDDEAPDECSLFLENLHHHSPAIIVQTESGTPAVTCRQPRALTYLEKNDSLEGIHLTLLKATSLALENHKRVEKNC